nr:PTS system mannose-specific EIID component [Candidatus Pantoea persica]
MAAPVLGVTMAMEEQRANGAPIDDGAINGIKVGLMGPLAGVGVGHGAAGIRRPRRPHRHERQPARPAAVLYFV